MPDTSVKFYHSDMPGAPVLNGTPGSLIGVLDACLINGFGLKVVESIVVLGGVATASISTGHSLEPGAVAQVAGANAALNGEQKITTTSTNTASWATTAADQTINSAGMTIKVASAGWLKAFAGVNMAAYKSTDVMGTGQFLQVNDSAAQNARVAGFELMTDVNTGTGMFPNVAQQPGGFWWAKSSAATSASRPWVVFADGRFFYLARGHLASQPLAFDLAYFGDTNSTKLSGDPFSCVITGSSTDKSTDFPVTGNQGFQASSSLCSAFMSRSYTGYGSPVQLRRNFPNTGNATDAYSGNTAAMPYPNPIDGGLYVVPFYLSEPSGALRATLPGFYAAPQQIPVGSILNRTDFSIAQGLPGKTLKSLVSTVPNWSVHSTSFFDVTGPWR